MGFRKVSCIPPMMTFESFRRPAIQFTPNIVTDAVNGAYSPCQIIVWIFFKRGTVNNEIELIFLKLPLDDRSLIYHPLGPLTNP